MTLGLPVMKFPRHMGGGRPGSLPIPICSAAAARSAAVCAAPTAAPTPAAVAAAAAAAASASVAALSAAASAALISPSEAATPSAPIPAENAIIAAPSFPRPGMPGRQCLVKSISCRAGRAPPMKTCEEPVNTSNNGKYPPHHAPNPTSPTRAVGRPLINTLQAPAHRTGPILGNGNPKVGGCGWL